MAVEQSIIGTIARTLSHDWWVVLLRGMIAIVFAILCFARPGISLGALVLWFGAYALIDGVFKSWTAISHRRETDNWGILLLSGLVGIGIGILTWRAPGMTALALVFYIAIWAIATGLMELVTAIRLRKEIEGEWSLALAGLAAIAFGVLLIARPESGALGLLWMIASFALVFGIALVVLSFRLRSLAHRLEPRLAT
jgi:uncharacterized membrane protein HdeD (DUF308 family)